MKPAILLFSIIFCLYTHAQNGKDTTAVKTYLHSLNRFIDQAVVKKDTIALKRLYADDFRFLHATGMRDTKATWLRGVSNPVNAMASREHDSTEVELHGNVALVAGTLSVRFPTGSARKAYALRYIRLYALRGRDWQLVSHRSTREWILE